MSEDRVVVIGGGLAGITAALLLAEAGLPVTVLEERPWLGGATWSFGRRGLTIDNGQHVFLRCFTAYRELLARLSAGHSVSLQDRLDVTVLGASGPVRLRRSNWPAPTHLAGMLARYRPLTPSERLGVLPAAMGMWLSDLSSEGNELVAMGDWLGRHGQDEQAIRHFWEMFLVPFLNAKAADADLGTAASLVNTALLSRRDQADLGIAAVPLRDLHAGPAARLLAELDVELRLGARVVSVRREPDGGYLVQLDAGSDARVKVPGQLSLEGELPDAITCSGVVLAVPAWSAAALVPAELSARTAGWSQLKPSPIVSIHVIYDTPVTRLPFATAIDSPLRWIVDKTLPAGLHTGQYLAASVPVAGTLVDEPPAAIRARLLPELERLFPAAAAARVEDFFVTRERCATFLPAPGSRALRPGQATGLPGFALAGAWTDTGWPDTMEGAVRSGQLAGEAILRVLAGAPAERAISPADRAICAAGAAGQPLDASGPAVLSAAAGAEIMGAAETEGERPGEAQVATPADPADVEDTTTAADGAASTHDVTPADDAVQADDAVPAADAVPAHDATPAADDAVPAAATPAAGSAADVKQPAVDASPADSVSAGEGQGAAPSAGAADGSGGAEPAEPAEVPAALTGVPVPGATELAAAAGAAAPPGPADPAQAAANGPQLTTVPDPAPEAAGGAVQPGRQVPSQRSAKRAARRLANRSGTGTGQAEPAPADAADDRSESAARS
jgi:squalene-associated FAD-dependent desaturase